MSIRLYMDVHVPAAVRRGLLLRNVDVLTSQLDGTMELDDSDLLDRVRANWIECWSVRTRICWPKPRAGNETGSRLGVSFTHIN